MATRLSLTVLVVAACASAPARTAAPPADAGLLHATLWVQTAAEYEAATIQAFHAAERGLPAALADSSWTAALEQEPPFAALPPAIVVDVDETVLDNSPYEARIVLAGSAFDPVTWEAWVEEARARPIPGALAFARAADSLGVILFYVTNRDHALEPATKRNLRAAGFPLADGRDVVLTRGERPEWTSDKSSRRAHVAETHRVLLVIGDDLNDFVAARTTLERRQELLERHRERWGRAWIVLPNPLYGSWEAALVEDEDPTPEERRRALLERLETLE